MRNPLREIPYFFPMIFVILAIFLLIVPFLVGRYYIYITTTAIIFGIFALSYNLILGYMGKVSFAHAIFFGIGGYTVAVGMTGLPFGLGVLSFWQALFLGIFLAMIFASLIGVIALRLEDIYFTMFTLAAAGVFHSLIVNLRGITQGIDGIIVPRDIGIELLGFKIDFATTVSFYYLVTLLFFVTATIMYIISNSHFGKILKATNSNIDRVRFAGINPYRVQLVNWVIASGFAAIAGGLYSVLVGHIVPTTVGISMSTRPLVMSLIGGMNTFIGPVVGSFILIFVEEEMSSLVQHWFLAIGVVVVIIALFFPEGIIGLIKEKRVE